MARRPWETFPGARGTAPGMASGPGGVERAHDMLRMAAFDVEIKMRACKILQTCISNVEINNEFQLELRKTVGRKFENTVHTWRTLRRQAAKGYVSRGATHQKSQPYSQETAPTVFDIPLSARSDLNTVHEQMNTNRS